MRPALRVKVSIYLALTAVLFAYALVPYSSIAVPSRSDSWLYFRIRLAILVLDVLIVVAGVRLLRQSRGSPLMLGATGVAMGMGIYVVVVTFVTHFLPR